MATEQVNCAKHGAEDFAIACIHVCRAIDSGADVGFYWSLETTGPRPDVWCAACERWSLNHPSATTKEWMEVCSFQFLCVRCWDEAKAVLYDRFQAGG
jgi:hypothetical protein